jgi:hypothetical protein
MKTLKMLVEVENSKFNVCSYDRQMTVCAHLTL